MTIQGDGKQQRSFLYVSDFVDAMLCIAERGVDGAIYNISSNIEASVLDVAREISRHMRASPLIMFVRDRHFNDVRYRIQGEALLKLGWTQKVSLREAIGLTVDWYTTKMPPDFFVEP